MNPEAHQEIDTKESRPIKVSERKFSSAENAYFVGEGVHGNAESPSQTKVTNLELAFPIDKELFQLLLKKSTREEVYLISTHVLWFEIPMENPVLMAEGNTFAQLMHKTFHCGQIKSAALSVSVHVALEVLLAEFENKDEFLLGVDDIVEANDVGVTELLHERDFSDGG